MEKHNHNPKETEMDLLQALDRLRQGSPTHPELVKKSRRRKLKVSISTVALEARHSRTLISHQKCAFPDVRAAILDLMEPKQLSGTMSDVNRKLRQENARIGRDLKIALSQLASMVRRMDRVEKQAARDSALAARILCRRGANVNQIAGAKLAGSESFDEETVVEIDKRRRTPTTD
jgi:hypothetical protein